MDESLSKRGRKSGAAGHHNQLGQSIGSKGVQTRRKLLQAVVNLLRKKSLLDLTIADIARVAGTSQATFYVYFKDVPDIVLSVVGGISQSPPRLLILFSTPWNVANSFKRALDFTSDYVETWEENAPLFRARNHASDEGWPQFTDIRVSAISPLIAIMAQRIDQRQTRGELPPMLQPYAMAGALLAMIERLASARRPEKSTTTQRRLIDVASYLSVLLFCDGNVRDSRQAYVENEGYQPGYFLAQYAGEPSNFPANLSERNISHLLNHKRSDDPLANGPGVRRSLIETMDQLLKSRPLREISVAEVCRNSGVSASSFYRHFGEISDLLLATIEYFPNDAPELLYYASRLDANASSDFNSASLVRSYVVRLRYRKAMYMARNLAADAGDKRFLDARINSSASLLATLSRRVSEGQVSGQIPENLHPLSMASAILAMVERISLIPDVMEDDPLAENLIRSASFLVALLMGAETLAPENTQLASVGTSVV